MRSRKDGKAEHALATFFAADIHGSEECFRGFGYARYLAVPLGRVSISLREQGPVDIDG
jgi:hypothetical protein